MPIGGHGQPAGVFGAGKQQQSRLGQGERHGAVGADRRSGRLAGVGRIPLGMSAATTGTPASCCAAPAAAMSCAVFPVTGP
jgi:hypothetical protein